MVCRPQSKEVTVGVDGHCRLLGYEALEVGPVILIFTWQQPLAFMPQKDGS